jgi:hypothetical protein
MGMPAKSIELSAEEVARLVEQLAAMRHNVNNALALIVAAGELAQRKADLVGRFANTISTQPERIAKEVRAFSNILETALGIAHAEPKG